MLTAQMHTTKEGTSSAAGQTEAGFWAGSVESSTARLCRGYGPCPSRTAAGDTNTYRLKAVAVSLPIGKENSTRERSMRSCPTHKCLPQRKELRVQPDKRRQAFWVVSGERSTARQCRGCGPCPSRTAAEDTNTYRLKAVAASLPIGKQNSCLLYTSPSPRDS